MTAVVAERDAVAGSLGARDEERLGPYEVRSGRDVVVLAGGVGPAAAAAATGTGLALHPAERVVCAGIGGGFAGRAPVGSVVEATTIVAADLGADTPEGFLPLADLGFGPVAYGALPLGLPGAVRGVVLTVSTVTGTDARASALAARHEAAAEGMEGFGVATAAAAHGLPVGEVRAISNAVGRRDRAAWDLPKALAALAVAARSLR